MKGITTKHRVTRCVMITRTQGRRKQCRAAGAEATNLGQNNMKIKEFGNFSEGRGAAAPAAPVLPAPLRGRGRRAFLLLQFLACWCFDDKKFLQNSIMMRSVRLMAPLRALTRQGKIARAFSTSVCHAASSQPEGGKFVSGQ